MKSLSRKSAEGVLLLTTAIWGSTFLIIKLLVSTDDSFSPFVLLSIRFTIATIAAYLLFGIGKRFSKQELLSGFIIGVFAFGGYAFQTIGLQYTTAAKSGFITSLFIILVPFVSILWEKEKIPFFVFISLIPAIIGLWLISGAGMSIANINVGDRITIFSAISYAFQVVSIQVYTKKYNWRWLTIFQFATIALGSYIGIIFEAREITFSIKPMLGIIYLGLIASVGALGIQMFAQRFTTSARASMIYISEPIFASGFALIFIGENMTKIEYLGGLLIILSMVIGHINNKKNRVDKSNF